MNKNEIVMRKRIRGRQNYYVEMPEGSEIHIVNSENEIVASITMKNNEALIWGTKAEKSASPQKEIE